MADWNQPTSVPASNFQSGRGGVTLDRIILHHTWGFLASAIARFRQNGSQVSAHAIVGRDGSITSLVDIGDTAFHAGDFAMNQRSFGVEFESSQGDVPEFTDAQYNSGRDLIANVGSRQGFTPDASCALPHSAIVATACPGGLDIARLLAAVNPTPVPDPSPAAPVPDLTAIDARVKALEDWRKS